MAKNNEIIIPINLRVLTILILMIVGIIIVGIITYKEIPINKNITYIYYNQTNETIQFSNNSTIYVYDKFLDMNLTS